METIFTIIMLVAFVAVTIAMLTEAAAFFKEVWTEE